jgi:hypothetical protein
MIAYVKEKIKHNDYNSHKIGHVQKSVFFN